MFFLYKMCISFTKEKTTVVADRFMHFSIINHWFIYKWVKSRLLTSVIGWAYVLIFLNDCGEPPTGCMYLNCDQVCQHSDLPVHVMITSQWLHLLKCRAEMGHFEGQSVTLGPGVGASMGMFEC